MVYISVIIAWYPNSKIQSSIPNYNKVRSANEQNYSYIPQLISGHGKALLKLSVVDCGFELNRKFARRLILHSINKLFEEDHQRRFLRKPKPMITPP